MICIPSPREIPEFHESLTKLPYHKILARYYPEKEAYPILRDAFLNTKCRIMVLFADDLIVHPKVLEMVMETHKRYPRAVVSGICNFDAWNNRNKYCFRLIGTSAIYPPTDPYGFAEFMDINGGIKYQQSSNEMKVAFNAFACVIIPRPIVEKIPFRFDSNGSGVDQNFCDDALKQGRDLIVNVSACALHLAGRKKGELENFMVGKKTPKIEYLRPLVC